MCHGTSGRHALTIAEGVEEKLGRALGREPGHVEGRRAAEWILLDYIDFIVHVFTADRRAFSGLERLWGDAPRLALPDEEPRALEPRRRRAKSPA